MLTQSPGKEEVVGLLERRDWKRLREVLNPWQVPEVADLVRDLQKPDRVLLLRALTREHAAEVFTHFEGDEQNQLLKELTDEETRQLLRELPPDDRTHLLEELPAQMTRRVLNLLAPEDLAQARQLLGYPDESVGRLMTPDYVALRPEWTARQALEHVRAFGKDSETIFRVYVVDAGWHLLDDISLRKVILAPPETTVEELMDHSFVSVSAFDDREATVGLIQRYDVVALPVVDSEGVLLGIVTVDDVLDVAQAEATEDFHRVASVGPIRVSLREAPLGMLYRRRIGWLLALVGMNVFSGAGIAYFEETIAATVALVFFLPLLIDSAGNAGSQAATLMVRAMATGDVLARDWLRLAGKELAVAAALGLSMAAAVSIIGVFRAGPDVAVVVALTMLAVVTVGSLVGMSLPFLLERLKMDPATASAPLVTSVADISGVLLYFSIASWYLG